ncbi:MAG TPA: carboxypeptidase-like regulatory domain-containing protein, partial [Chitinophagaceae bacterium]|nr:carboxypeptidase-like regulatory domain-containing protein [Chitinophagaceae bacterium]
MFRCFALTACLIVSFQGLAQSSLKDSSGILAGNVMDDKKKALEGASVELIPFSDSSKKRSALSDKDGAFSIPNISFGYFKLRISYVGMQTLMIDSIHFREERNDFNFGDITLKIKTDQSLDEVIVYAEKPLVQSKEGNITFNVAESALAAGSNASELLTNVPLVTKDANGKILVRGKEPKILIDDKPVELNLQQVQDLLESLPGSSIEKIEVMTNPPPQYANEQGGVINIVTRKGKVGRSGRIGISAGTRGEVSINGNYNYRKLGFSLNINAGVGYNHFSGNGNSTRNNFYTDSSNFFNTKNDYVNKNLRPNFRMNIDYDLDKSRSLNFVLQYNENDFLNNSNTEYTNINRFGDIYKLSERQIRSEGDNYNPNANITYTQKGRVPGEQLKIILGGNLSLSKNQRDFYQQYFNPDHSPNGLDSTQKQFTDNRSNGYSARLNYDRPLENKKTFFSVGGYYNRSNSHIITDASFLKRPEEVFIRSSALSNDFRFH